MNIALSCFSELQNEPQVKMSRRKIVDFGGWVRQVLASTSVTPSDLSRETGIPYPSLDRILKSGEKGNPVRPDKGTIEKIGSSLVRLNIIQDENEAWAAAGFIADGFRIARIGSDGTKPGDAEHDEEEDVAFLRGLPPTQREKAKKMLQAAFAEDDAEDNEGNIGKRAE